MREGALIDCRIRVHGVPMRWSTRMRAWEPSHRFVDEQLSRPYRQGIHQHTFELHAGGTLARDHVRYALAMDFGVHRWFVPPGVE